jgi:hypothetical protein
MGENEALTKMVEKLEADLDELRNMIIASKPIKKQAVDERESKVVSNIKDIGVQDAVVYAMLIKVTQTKEELKRTLDVWGVAYGSWFDGGNFNNRLLKNGIIKVDRKNEKGEEIYSLTMNGERIADEKLVVLQNRKG